MCQLWPTIGRDSCEVYTSHSLSAVTIWNMHAQYLALSDQFWAEAIWVFLTNLLEPHTTHVCTRVLLTVHVYTDHSPISPSLQAATRDLPESWGWGSARMRVRAAAASSRAELKFNFQSDVFRICHVIALTKYYLPRKKLFLIKRAFVCSDK